jgi:two-component system phosphate regulon sensor histidine kinase PhoR
MKRKILSYYIVFVIILILFISIFMFFTFRTFYKQEVKERLILLSELVDYSLNDNNAGYNETVNSIKENLSVDIRITVIDSKGIVLAETEADYRDMGNHLNRPEIQKAIESGTGSNIRYSDTIKKDYYYLANYISKKDIFIRVSMLLTQFDDINALILRFNIGFILFSIIVSIVLVILFSKNTIGPIKELIEASKEITYGNYSKRLKVFKEDELGKLIKSFNFMASKLDVNVTEIKNRSAELNTILENIYDGIIAIDENKKIRIINESSYRIMNIDKSYDYIGRNIIECIRNGDLNEIIDNSINDSSTVNAELYLKAENEKKIIRTIVSPIRKYEQTKNMGTLIVLQDISDIRKMEEVRKDFVSNVTHELKTPLTSIKGFIETLKEGAINEPEIATNFLDIIDIESDRLTMLINDILYLSEIENKKTEVNNETIKLNDLIEEVILILKTQAQKKNIKISIENTTIELRTNKDRLKQLLINLVDNAIKYNKENGSVNISCQRKGIYIRIIVSDTGIGIAEKHMERIFERFYRVDKGRSREMGGTGLGLSIVKHIVNLLSGKIKVNSNPGEGTSFYIDIPWQ